MSQPRIHLNLRVSPFKSFKILVTLLKVAFMIVVSLATPLPESIEQVRFEVSLQSLVRLHSLICREASHASLYLSTQDPELSHLAEIKKFCGALC